MKETTFRLKIALSIKRINYVKHGKRSNHNLVPSNSCTSKFKLDCFFITMSAVEYGKHKQTC